MKKGMIMTAEFGGYGIKKTGQFVRWSLYKNEKPTKIGDLSKK